MIIKYLFIKGIKVRRYILAIFIGLIFFFLGLFGLLLRMNVHINFFREILNYTRIRAIYISLLIAGGYAVLAGISGILRKMQAYAHRAALDVNTLKYVAKSNELERGAEFVVIGGGTGISNLLKGLKRFSSNITAVVTVTDEGGSSGRLRETMNILPPGDIRNCIVSLAEDDILLSRVFQYRFTKGELKGHSLGNLLIAGMTELQGDFIEGLVNVGRILSIRGTVLPSTTENVRLKAVYEDGSTVMGEVNIEQTPKRIEKMEIIPENAHTLPEVIEAINKADYIFIGPGSLFTSIIPNLLIKDIAAALASTTAKKIYIANVMTQQFETQDMTLSEHIKAIMHNSNDRVIDCCLVHNADISKSLEEKYRSEGAFKVKIDTQNLENIGMPVYFGDFLRDEEDYLRHSAEKIWEFIKTRKL